MENDHDVAQYRLVRVDWIDSNGSRDGWVPLETVRDVSPMDVHSVGWVVHEDEVSIVLVPHFAVGVSVAGDFRIPRVAITSIIDLVPVPLSSVRRYARATAAEKEAAEKTKGSKMTNIDASAIRVLRGHRIELCAELDQLDADLAELGVNPRLGSLLVSILKCAARPLSTWLLYNHTKELGLHHHTMRDFVLHLDRLHAAGTIVTAGDRGWTTRRPAPPRTLPSTPALSVD